jgi:hypothetical protein
MRVLRQIFERSLYRRTASAGVVLISLAGAAACSKADNTPPVATPTFTASKERVALGAPIDMTFQFDVAAPIKDDYRVLVHVVNPDGDTIWIDDHDPVIPTSQWKPGQKIQYTRQEFLPVLPFTGEATVRIGLYRGDDRLPMQGADPIQRTYKVGTLQLLPQSENVFIIYKSGWNSPEFTPDNAREWQWTQKSATVNFKNPRKDVMLYLETDARTDLFTPPQQVSLVIAGKTVKTFAADAVTSVMQRIPITAAELGGDDMVELRLDVDKTFVPAKLPNATNQDIRELGVRVYHLFVDPR